MLNTDSTVPIHAKGFFFAVTGSLSVKPLSLEHKFDHYLVSEPWPPNIVIIIINLCALCMAYIQIIVNKDVEINNVWDYI